VQVVICNRAPGLLPSGGVKFAISRFALVGLIFVFEANGAQTPLANGQTNQPAATRAERPKLRPGVPGSEIFDQPTVLDFHVELSETNNHDLETHPREYTRATVVVNGVVFRDVGVKLKGRAGSFRSVDDRPAMTLHFSKWVTGRRVFGLRRLYLNNSVQDESRLNEYVASDLFRAAGVPTPRVAWAMVRLNNRKLGLYVLKEAFETEFLRIYFGSAKGNLYDGEFLRDVDQDLSRESGDGRDDHTDLHALREAVNEKDRAVRWEKLNRILDVDKFAAFAALEVMMADWDGYPLNRNNYRLYFRPEDGRGVFMPHGMDQLFDRTYIELDSSWSGSVAWALFDTPEGQKLYENSCRQVFTNVFQLERMTNLVSRAAEAIKEVYPQISYAASEVQDRIQRRHRTLRRDPILRSPPVTSPESTNSPSRTSK